MSVWRQIGSPGERKAHSPFSYRTSRAAVFEGLDQELGAVGFLDVGGSSCNSNHVKHEFRARMTHGFRNLGTVFFQVSCSTDMGQHFRSNFSFTVAFFVTL